eukprot:jgi/Chrzof1/2941/Cz12g05080.t1
MLHAARYADLRTNLPREVMSFNDFPFIPAAMEGRSHDARRFPKHTEVKAFLQAYADEFGVIPLIRFNTHVVRIDPLYEQHANSTGAAAPAPAAAAASVEAAASCADLKTAAQPMTYGTAAGMEQRQVLYQQQAACIKNHKGICSCMPHVCAGHQRKCHCIASACSTNSDVTSSRYPSSSSSSNSHSSTTESSSSSSTGRPPPRWQVITTRVHDGPFNISRLEAGVCDGSVAHQVWDFDAVISCVGNYHEPNIPGVRGLHAFPGHQLHCHNYRSAEEFEGQVVMVVGASISGEEIARLIANVASHVYHSACSWPQNNFTNPPQPRGNLQRVPMVVELTADGSAVLADGQVLQSIDAVVYCTGYKYCYPWLQHLGLLTTDDMRVHPLYKHTFIPAVAPSLAVIGVSYHSLRFTLFPYQAKWVARVLSGRAALPPQQDMEQDIQLFYQLLQDNHVPVRHTHNHNDTAPINSWQFIDELIGLMGPGVNPPESWRRQVLTAAVSSMKKRPETFRDVYTAVEEHLYEQAYQACLDMWRQHLTRHNDRHT